MLKGGSTMSYQTVQKLGELLLENHYIREEQLNEVLEKQKHSNKRIGELLIDMNYIDRNQLVEALGEQLGFEHVRLSKYSLSPELSEYIPENLAAAYNLVPLEILDNSLKIAMLDPLDLEPIDLINSINDFKLEIFIATKKEIESAQRLIYDDQMDSGSPQSVPKIAQKIIKKAVINKATDIHVDPEENILRIRYRINGILQTEMNLAKEIQINLASHLKTLAKLDITKTRVPQSGSLKLRLGSQEINARISTLPTSNGEKIVIRLLLKDHNLLDINNLGFSDYNLKRLKSLIEKPYGLILVTGPTSSGKTTTLAAALNYKKSPENNIITIEDPIEYHLDGVYQVQANSDSELTFPDALRSALRQDPDIIMIGEIRDKETAEIAVRAAITGHLVLSSLHTQDSASVIARLKSLGIPSYLIHSTLLGVVAQRLVRVLCDCRDKSPLTNKEKDFLDIPLEENSEIYNAVGCRKCSSSGYYDQTTIEEVLMLDQDYENLIVNEANKKQIISLAKEKGFKTLKENSREKISKNITTFSEIKRVLL